MTKIEAAKAKMNEAREEMRRLGKEGLMEALRELTKDLSPLLTFFSWKQYTDYFNDGDSCTFSVHADPDYGMTFNGVEGEELEESTEHADLHKALFAHDNEDGYCRPVPALKKVIDFLNDNEEFLEEAIGDHLTVTYFRPHAEGGERIETEECDHD